MATLTAYRRAIAPKLGFYHQGTATSGSSTSALEDTAYPIKTSDDTADLYTGKILFRPAAALASDKTRFVHTYDPATGVLTPDLAWTNSPVSEVYEIHHIVPPDRLTERINDALRRVMIPSEVSLTPIALATRHSLTAVASWLTSPLWVLGAGVLGTGAVRAESDPYVGSPVRGVAESDGATIYLNTHPASFAVTDTLYVRALRPAYDQCAGVATPTVFTQTGLVLEGDLAIPPLDLVVQGTLVEVWDGFRHVLEREANKQVLQDMAEAAARFSDLHRFYYPPQDTTLQRRVAAFGPRR